MSDLIRRIDALGVLQECHLDEQLFEKEVFDKIKNLPTIEAVPLDRNRIIDEFADKLKKRYPIMENDLFTINDKLHDEIDKIAKQMKGGNG